MRREVKTERTITDTETVVECDRCGKPAQFLDWNTGLQIPVVELKSKYDNHSGHHWVQRKVDCCRECAEMLWRMFNCRGITREEQLRNEGKQP